MAGLFYSPSFYIYKGTMHRITPEMIRTYDAWMYVLARSSEGWVWVELWSDGW